MVYEWWFGWEIMEKWEKHEIFYAYFSLETVLGTWCPEKTCLIGSLIFISPFWIFILLFFINIFPLLRKKVIFVLASLLCVIFNFISILYLISYLEISEICNFH